MDEIFDNMGGGRNTSIYVDDDSGSFGINNMSFGGNRGITKSNMIGVNYQDKFFKKIDQSGSYYFTNAETENANRTERINLLPEGRTFTNSQATTFNTNNGHNLNLDFEVKLDSTSTIYFNPSFKKMRTQNKSIRNQVTTNETNDELNSSSNEDYNENNNNTFTTNGSYSKQFKKKKRALVINFETEIQKTDNFLNTNSATLFADATPDDIRNQNQFEKEKNQFGKLEVRFGEPITDSIRLSLTSEVTFRKIDNSLNTFDFDSGSNNYDNFNDVQSNETFSKTTTFFPSTGLILNKSKTNGRLNFGPEFITFDTQSN
jgi:hypothetical protein